MAVDQTGLEGRNVTRFSYKHAKTLARFAASDAFIRGVMGPFGPTSHDTEYLTPNGWKTIDTYVDGDQIAQFDPITDLISFIKPEDYIVQPETHFYRFTGVYLDMMLSAEHRVLIENSKGEREVMLAEDVAVSHWNNNYFNPGRSTGFIPSIPTLFKIPDRPGISLSNNELCLMVSVVAEGSFHKHRRLPNTTYNTNGCTMGFVKLRKKQRIEKLLNSCDISFIKTDHGEKTYYYFNAPIKIKKFGSLFWEATKNQIQIILDELTHWDYSISGNSNIEYSTTEKESADFIQYCFNTKGIKTNINIKNYNDGIRKSLYRIRYRLGQEQKLSRFGSSKNSIEYMPYGNGYKYCFTTGTGFFVARRNGKIFITGNSGKSTACLFEIIRRAQAQRPAQDGIRRTRWAVIRNTFPQLIDTTIKTVKDWLPFETWGRYHAQRHDYTITGIEGCEIELMFRALDRPDHLRNLLGIEFTGAWINEGREVPRAILDGITGRVGRYPKVIDGGCSWFGIIMDTNPPDDESWWFKMFEEMEFPEDIEMFCPGCGIKFDVGINKGECPECKLKYLEIFKQPSGVSPLAENIPYLPPNYYTNMMIGKESDWIQVYVKGMYGVVQEGKPVYPMYNDRIHCSPVKFNPKFPVYRGWDFGLTPACIMAQMPPTGQLKVGYELCADRAGAERFSDEVLKYCAINMPGDKWEYIDIGDPAGNTASQTDEKTCFQILRGKGIKIQPGHQGLEMRLESVRYPLHTMIDGNPGIIIDPRCKRLRKGFLGRYQYRRKITSREEYHEVPDKNDYSHIHDGLQYICSALFSNVLKGRVAKLSRQVERDSWPEREGIKNKTNKYTGY